MTAYALAVEEGFKGSQEEWLASLKGDMGELTEEQENTLNNTAAHQADTQLHVSEEDRKAWDSKFSPDALMEEKSLTIGGTGDRGAATYITLSAQLLPKGWLLSLSLSVPDAMIPPSVDTEHELHAVLAPETGTRTY